MDTEHGVQSGRTEAHMLRWVSGFTLKEWKTNAETREVSGL